MKTRNNPFFPTTINNLVTALATYWRDMSRIVDGKGELYEKNEWWKGNAGKYKELLSDSGEIDLNLDEANNFFHVTTENTELQTPSRAQAGQAGVIQFTQDGSTAYTLDFTGFWRFPGGVCPELTDETDAVDVLSYVVSENANFATCVMLNNIKSCPGG